MPTGDLEALLDEETLRMEAFGEDIRDRMRSLMREIEREFQQFLEQMLREQTARFETGAQAALASTQTPAISSLLGSGVGSAREGASGQDSGSFISGALGAAFSAALNSFIRTGSVKPRAILNAGAHSIGASLGQAMTSPAAASRPAPEQMRLSRSQSGVAMMREIARAERNN